MCQSAVTLISKTLHTVDNDEKLLKIKGVLALFIQTMDVSSRGCYTQANADVSAELEFSSGQPRQVTSHNIRELRAAPQAKIQRRL